MWAGLQCLAAMSKAIVCGDGVVKAGHGQSPSRFYVALPYRYGPGRSKGES